MIRIMIVDDENGFRNLFAKIINWKNFGYELVGTAENGEQAIRILKENPCDIVFTDIEMPGVNGIEFMDYLQKFYPDIIIIVLSCYNEFEYARAALQRGAKDYIIKLFITPESIGELLEKLKRDVEQIKLRKTEMEINTVLMPMARKYSDTLKDKDWFRLQEPVRKVLEYIYISKRFDISLNEAAEKASLTPQYFSAIFKKDIGVNFVQYLSKMKIDYVKDLLLNTNKLIYEIGLEIGIENEGYFSRFFKKHTGISPAEFREKNK